MAATDDKPMVVWAIVEIDRDYFRDDLDAIEDLPPRVAYMSAEAGMRAVDADFAERDKEAESDQASDLYGKLRWAMVDDYWVAELRVETWPDGVKTIGHEVKVYPIRVEEGL